MWVQPDSNIYVCKGVPLSPSYKHSLFFASEANQVAYFSGTAVKMFTQQTYQRVERNKCRLECVAEEIYGCNYLMFQNHAFGDKWFFAFITGIEYINNRVSEITFQIDVLQTWLPQIHSGGFLNAGCYIERQHTVTDEVGEYLEPEPIDCSDSRCFSIEEDMANDLVIQLTIARQKDGVGYDTPMFMQGMYTGGQIFTYSADEEGARACNDKINQQLNLPNGSDSIVAIQLVPRRFATEDATPARATYTPSRPETIAGFVPKNKKLLCYPFSYLLVDSLNDSAVYRYEWFENQTPGFKMVGTTLGAPSMMVYPLNYEGINNGYSNSVICSGFPQCPWGGDAFKEWIANNGIQSLVKTGASLAGMATGNPAAIIAGSVGLCSTISSGIQAAISANGIRGGYTSYVAAQIGAKKFYFKHMSLSYPMAKLADDFLSRYGYARCVNDRPKINARPHWTYVKTADCCIKGNLPADDAATIAGMFDSGITFWINPSEVGDYSLDNSV